jgi:hypothetical protein
MGVILGRSEASIRESHDDKGANQHPVLAEMLGSGPSMTQVKKKSGAAFPGTAPPGSTGGVSRIPAED